MKKLESIQRKVSILITGALSSTPTDLLNIHADLLPMPLAIDKTRQRAAVRIASLPALHPLAPLTQDAASRKFIK